MGKRMHQPTPAVGITNKWRRDGQQISAEGSVIFQAKSLSQAKRYFRTGNPGRDPAKVKENGRVGAYIPKGRKA
jgi:hypothetical protein